jgi:fatty acid desaturase
MASGRAHESPHHTRIAATLVAETVVGFAALAVAALACRAVPGPYRWALLGPVVFASGLWLDRCYTVAHEAVHKKLFPRRPLLNDLTGMLLLLPIAAPLTVFRKVHYFHHGQNRKDPFTAALDVFVARRPVGRLRAAYYRAAWAFLVFLGGFFVHSLVTILLFLVAPTARARRLSPVFDGWRPALRARSWAEFAAGVTFHAVAYLLLGFEGWLVALGLPVLAFAWVWSMLLYVYHYATTVGPDVRHNVRSLPRHWFFSWLLLNFNEHATHHADPTIPWYALPANRHELPPTFRSNANVASIWSALWQQRRGPTIVEGSVHTRSPVSAAGPKP